MIRQQFNVLKMISGCRDHTSPHGGSNVPLKSTALFQRMLTVLRKAKIFMTRVYMQFSVHASGQTMCRFTVNIPSVGFLVLVRLCSGMRIVSTSKASAAEARSKNAQVKPFLVRGNEQTDKSGKRSQTVAGLG